MNETKHMKSITNIIYLVLALCAFTCVALLPCAQADSGPPDGRYPAGNTAEGFGALSRNTGYGNTAVGNGALNDNTTGSFNTAVGQHTLDSNTIGNENAAFGTKA